jgi:hypothetical protein
MEFGRFLSEIRREQPSEARVQSVLQHVQRVRQEDAAQWAAEHWRAGREAVILCSHRKQVLHGML